ncbi:MAG: hypothetical protein KF773_07300 [Deltaproteobacteria bacterium]|nr:hypothetical protein [Deltaproteobacteria bacterium]
MIRSLTAISLAVLAITAIPAAAQPQPYDVPGPHEVPPPPPPPPQDGYDPGEPVAPVAEVHVPVVMPPPPPREYDPGFALHLNIGAELLAGQSQGQAMTSFIARIHVGFSNPIGRGRVRPILGIGATAGMGILNVEDRRGLDGTVDLGHLDYGPEVQVGLRFVNGGHVDTRLFATLAYLRTNLDKRLELDAIPGVGGREGIRAALGINFADRIGVVMMGGTTRSRRRDKAEWYIAMVPQQVELAWERSAGSDRVGAAIGWGI